MVFFFQLKNIWIFFEDRTKMKITFWYLPTFKVRTRQGTERLLWVEIIQKYVGNIEEFPDTWEILVDKTPIEVVKDLALAVHQFFTSRLSRLVWPQLWSLGELNCWNLDFNPKWVVITLIRIIKKNDMFFCQISRWCI